MTLSPHFRNFLPSCQWVINEASWVEQISCQLFHVWLVHGKFVLVYHYVGALHLLLVDESEVGDGGDEIGWRECFPYNCIRCSLIGKFLISKGIYGTIISSQTFLPRNPVTRDFVQRLNYMEITRLVPFPRARGNLIMRSWMFLCQCQFQCPAVITLRCASFLRQLIISPNLLDTEFYQLKMRMAVIRKKTKELKRATLNSLTSDDKLSACESCLVLFQIINLKTLLNPHPLASGGLSLIKDANVF